MKRGRKTKAEGVAILQGPTWAHFMGRGKSKQIIRTLVLLEASADTSDICESHAGNPQANDWWMRRVANLTVKIKGVEGNQRMNGQD
ncbi:hypothetical protein Tco_1038395 [Tanacetum coccineum]